MITHSKSCNKIWRYLFLPFLTFTSDPADNPVQRSHRIHYNGVSTGEEPEIGKDHSKRQTWAWVILFGLIFICEIPWNCSKVKITYNFTTYFYWPTFNHFLLLQLYIYLTVYSNPKKRFSSDCEWESYCWVSKEVDDLGNPTYPGCEI